MQTRETMLRDLERESAAKRTYRFKFFDGSVFVGHGISVRDALGTLGLDAYNPSAYDVEDITAAGQK